MSLLSRSDCKAYLKIQGTAEDSLIDLLLANAKAAAEVVVRRPITATSQTFVLEKPAEALVRRITVLHVPVYPIKVDDTAGPYLTLTDGDGDTLVEGTDYRLDRSIGRLTALGSVAFDVWPYTIVATVGLSADPRYASRLEPAINAAILDIVADAYQRRSPAATNESTGGGVSASYAGGVPARALELLNPLRMARALG